jgi:cyclopropane-fatty-acyl-phospholipid synthase
MTTASAATTVRLDLPPAVTREPLGIRLAEAGRLPDLAIRLGIRRLLRERKASLDAGGPEAASQREDAFVRMIAASPLAELQAAANAQHYEVPAAFYATCLGGHRKYSSCFFATGRETLDQAEAAALTITCDRARLADGQRILELGCGWGSLSLWMASHYPKARITAVSNSRSQKAYIDEQARSRGLTNLEIVTADLHGFDPGATYDRIVSVECFEHLRNWPEMFRRVSTWLADGGRFFMHVFTHRHSSYLFQQDGEDDWMGRHFFSGGMMPADTLAPRLQDHLTLDGWWRWNGTHYGLTSDWWLRNLDRNRAAARAALAPARPDTDPDVLVQRWRMFFLACAELWHFDHGREWPVSHYAFAKR